MKPLKHKQGPSPYWGGGQFIALPQRFIESQTFRELTHSEFRVLFHLIGKLKPGRRMTTQNGTIIATELHMAELFGMKHTTVRAAIHSLIDKGIVKRLRRGGGGKSGNGKLPALYLLTMFLPGDDAIERMKVAELPITRPLNSWLSNEPLPSVCSESAEQTEIHGNF